MCDISDGFKGGARVYSYMFLSLEYRRLHIHIKMHKNITSNSCIIVCPILHFTK